MEAWQATQSAKSDKQIQLYSIMRFENYSQALLTHPSPLANVLLLILLSYTEVIVALTERVTEQENNLKKFRRKDVYLLKGKKTSHFQVIGENALRVRWTQV
jgi:hypothetical protein